MNRDNEGSILILTLLLITVFLTLYSGLVLIINNEIKMAYYNQNRIKAGYKAEAALAEAKNIINNNTDVLEEDLTEIYGTIEQEGDYYIKEALITGEEGSRTYELTAEGISKNVARTITVIISP